MILKKVELMRRRDGDRDRDPVQSSPIQYSAGIVKLQNMKLDREVQKNRRQRRRKVFSLQSLISSSITSTIVFKFFKGGKHRVVGEA
ncbi:hypothetical protein QYF36_022439 [Acer negundo]|nr:hypothetical protein QYF36_022439 [Acer negundo]